MEDKKTPIVFTPPIKLRHDKNKDAIVIDLERDFGFVPKKIVVRLQTGRSNVIQIGAFDANYESKLLKEMKPSPEKGKDYENDQI